MATAAARANVFECASTGGGWKKAIQKAFTP
jgi:hypothetical protein